MSAAVGSTTARADEALRRLPAGATELAADHVAGGLSALGLATDTFGDRTWAARRLVRPLDLTPDWPEPTPPFRVGDGAVHADLIDEDHESLARLRVTLGDARPDPETLAAEAQAWRLAVTPYRRLPSPRPGAAAHQRNRTPETARVLDPADLTIVDLSALWAGPLATSLFAALGARVIKVDPSVRPDALRRHEAFFAELNGAKESVDLDLRRDEDRRRFDSLLSGADVVVDSFSRRVMPNLGYGPNRLAAAHPDLVSASLVAFDATAPERDWIAYGPGVHAISGLAERPDGRFESAPIAYPDALSGLALFAAIASAVTSGTEGGSSSGNRRRVEVSLAGSLEPLVTAATGRRSSEVER